MNNIEPVAWSHRSVLASLRRLIPERGVELPEALHIAELQADLLLELTGDNPTTVDQRVARLPRICLQYRQMPTSGLSYWDGQAWIVCLNQTEPATRQRFTLLHEYKHIIDHGSTDRMFTGSPGRVAAQQTEQAADYFAGCALMPERLLRQAWRQGERRTEDLATMFNVSTRAVEVRLAQIGLKQNVQRCVPSSFGRLDGSERRLSGDSRAPRYYRASSIACNPKAIPAPMATACVRSVS